MRRVSLAPPPRGSPSPGLRAGAGIGQLGLPLGFLSVWGSACRCACFSVAAWFPLPPSRSPSPGRGKRKAELSARTSISVRGCSRCAPFRCISHLMLLFPASLGLAACAAAPRRSAENSPQLTLLKMSTHFPRRILRAPFCALRIDRRPSLPVLAALRPAVGLPPRRSPGLNFRLLYMRKKPGFRPVLLRFRNSRHHPAKPHHPPNATKPLLFCCVIYFRT